ncbi:MAG: tetratricopeptide repeat protein [Leptospiraceae bacterium]|nr:tetratricopeptide repeat protein [Leptospiraceae bacterium]MCK6381091.1 tetratricopeptide repeat protein [Leptospiraceae bacterium]NUM40544.1 tetratricopeptide repeat protein [Leptospiraceae bacterium]
MRKAFILFLCTIFPIFSISKKDYTIYAFWDKATQVSTKMKVIGETVSIEKAAVFETKADSSLNVDTRPDVVTVNVHSNPGIRIGQTLYLIEKDSDHNAIKDGNIVGQIEVKSIFKTTFFGLQLRGEGYLRLIEGRLVFVAMPVESGNQELAILKKKEGDYFVAIGDKANAIKTYKKAISIDPIYPEAHFALGKLHLQGGEGYISAGFEFSLAYKNIDKFRDNHEKFLFLSQYMSYLLYKFKTEKGLYLKDIELCYNLEKLANEILPNDFDILLNSAETNFLHYRFLESGQKNPETISVIMEKMQRTEDLLEKAKKLRYQNSNLQRLLVLAYYEKLKYLKGKVILTYDMKKDSDTLKQNIANHGNDYLTFLSKKKNADKEVLSAIELSKSF